MDAGKRAASRADAEDFPLYICLHPGYNVRMETKDHSKALADLQAAACTYSLFVRRSKPEERKQLTRQLSEAAVAYAALHHKFMATKEETR